MIRRATLAAAALAIAAAAGLLAWRGVGTAGLADVNGVAIGRSPGPGPQTAATGSKAFADVRQFWAAYDEASGQRTAGRMEAAIAAYRRALEIRPDHEDGLYYLGNCLLERGEHGAALDAYRRLVAVNPEGSSRGYMQLALIHASLTSHPWRDLDAAERLFRRALEVDPDSGALLGLGEVALLRRDWPRAEMLLQRAGNDNAMSVAVPFLLGYLAFQRRDEAAALRLFEIAVSRGELKKSAIKWTEEGDVKADPGLRWRALARQSVFGEHWLGLRRYLAPPGPSASDMRRQYRQLSAALPRPAGR